MTKHFSGDVLRLRLGPLYACNRRLWTCERKTNNSHAYVRKITIGSHGQGDWGS